MSEDTIEEHQKETGSASGAPEPPPGDDARAEIEQLRASVKDMETSAQSYKDQLLRKAAELENYRRRSEAEAANLIQYASERLLLSLLPVLDDFTRSLKAGAESRDYEAFYRGVELIQGKFTRTLEKHGLMPFESLGKPFDVAYHDALLQIPRADVPPHTVLEEVERGYMLHDRVLRHAKVIVSAEPEPPAEPSDGEHASNTEASADE